MECIQGLRRPDSGTLRVLGFDPVTQAARMRPLLGSQLQDSALPDRLRVAEAVELFARHQTRRAGELLMRFGLAARRKSAFSSLSGGERQRLFLVLALLNQPRLVILDELTQGLDPAARRTVWDAIRQLHADGTTVHFTWPDPPPALLEEMNVLDGVRRVERSAARITVLTVYRIAQEALTNAAKHAAGAPTAVALAVGPASVRLTIDSAAKPGAGSGLGLISMRKRAESIGGTCQAGPGGRGWLVDAVLPLASSRRVEGAA